MSNGAGENEAVSGTPVTKGARESAAGHSRQDCSRFEQGMSQTEAASMFQAVATDWDDQ